MPKIENLSEVRVLLGVQAAQGSALFMVGCERGRGHQPASTGAETERKLRRKRDAYPELSKGGPQKLVVLGSEVGGRWSQAALHLVRDLVRIRAQRAPPAL